MAFGLIQDVALLLSRLKRISVTINVLDKSKRAIKHVVMHWNTRKSDQPCAKSNVNAAFGLSDDGRACIAGSFPPLVILKQS